MLTFSWLSAFKQHMLCYGFLFVWNDVFKMRSWILDRFKNKKVWILSIKRKKTFTVTTVSIRHVTIWPVTILLRWSWGPAQFLSKALQANLVGGKMSKKKLIFPPIPFVPFFFFLLITSNNYLLIFVNIISSNLNYCFLLKKKKKVNNN